MKKIILLVFLCSGFSFVQAQVIKLPSECRKTLNKEYRGWKFAEIQSEISKYYRKMNFSFAPNFIKGDWNGDGKADYAVLIEQGTLKNSAGESIGAQRFTVAFVRTKNGYKRFSFDGGDAISLMKKGTKDYNYETRKNFRYQTDAISDGFWEKAGVSYIWKNGKFIIVSTND